MKIFVIAVVSSLSVLAVSMAAATSDPLVMDFDEGVDGWRVVVDGVMGGRSTGRINQPDPGVLSFTGDLSLENNGGFSQIRRSVSGNRFANARGIELTVRGDGREYRFDVRCSNVRLMAGGFQQAFRTEAGEWTTVRLAFDDFRLYTFGRAVPNPPALDPALIESIGITLSDKREGSFRLDIDSIQTFVDDRAGVTAIRAADAPSDAKPSILTLALRSRELGTLSVAVGAAELGDLLTDDGPWTVFAPVDSAFAALPAGSLDDLVRPENRARLVEILGLHVVPGRIPASQLLATGHAETLSGDRIDFGIEAGRLQVNGADIIGTDLEARNGVVHLIDSVLLPPRPAATVSASRSAEAVRLCELAIERGVPLFNAGQHAACASVYEVLIESMVALGGADLGTDVVRILEAGLAEARRHHDWSDRAWACRRALDGVYPRLVRQAAGTTTTASR